MESSLTILDEPAKAEEINEYDYPSDSDLDSDDEDRPSKQRAAETGNGNSNSNESHDRSRVDGVVDVVEGTHATDTGDTVSCVG